MYCNKCGAPMADDAKFCSRCGAVQSTPEPQARPAAQAKAEPSGNPVASAVKSVGRAPVTLAANIAQSLATFLMIFLLFSGVSLLPGGFRVIVGFIGGFVIAFAILMTIAGWLNYFAAYAKKGLSTIGMRMQRVMTIISLCLWCLLTLVLIVSGIASLITGSVALATYEEVLVTEAREEWEESHDAGADEALDYDAVYQAEYSRVYPTIYEEVYDRYFQEEADGGYSGFQAALDAEINRYMEAYMTENGYTYEDYDANDREAYVKDYVERHMEPYEIIVGVLLVLIWVLIGCCIMMIVYCANVIGKIGQIKNAIAFGKPYKRISAFLPVMLFALAGIGALAGVGSLILAVELYESMWVGAFLFSAVDATASIFFGITLLKYRKLSNQLLLKKSFG